MPILAPFLTSFGWILCDNDFIAPENGFGTVFDVTWLCSG